MSKIQPTASKQRKARKAENKAKSAAVVEVNERQIASGVLSTTGEAGTDFVNRVSDWLQANSRIVVPLIVAGLLAVVFFMVLNRAGTGERHLLDAKLLRASFEEKPDDVRKAFDGLAKDVEDKPEKQADYYYEYARTLWSALVRQTGDDKAAPKDFQEVIKNIDAYLEAAPKPPHPDPAYGLRKRELEALKKQLTSDIEAMAKDARLRWFEDSEYKDGRETKIEEGAAPIIALETSRGKIVIELFDDPNLRNTIDTIVTLAERGYYKDEAPFIKRPGMSATPDPLFGSAAMAGFGNRGKLKELPKAEEIKEDDDKKKKEEEEKKKKKADKKKSSDPYFFILPETRAGERFSNTAGTVCLYYEQRQPNKRGAQFGINLTDNKHLDGIYQVIGKVTEGLDIAATLTNSDKIYSAFVVQKDKRDYTPKVIFLEGPQKTGIPTLWIEEEPKIEPPRLTRPEKPALIDEKANPVVVISTDKGDIEIELYEDNTPNTVANFIHLIEKGHYKGSSFHRVGPFSKGTKPERMAQGGRKNGTENEFDWTIKNEAISNDKYGKLRNTLGTVAMWREEEEPDSAGAQFFINLQDYRKWDENHETDKKKKPYCVFGRVKSNLWVAFDIRPDDKILDAWVVQKRDHAYIPEVKRKGESKYAPAEKPANQ